MWTGKSNNSTSGNSIIVDGTILDSKGLSTRLWVGKSRDLVGFAGDGKTVVTGQREYNLVSGFHRLLFTPIDGEAGPKGGGFGDVGGGSTGGRG